VSGAEISDDELARLWHSVVAGTARLRRLLERDIEATGVPAQWFTVLDLLARAEDHRLPMSVLARELSMTSGGLSKLADRMALEGLIDRRGASDDRRVVYATLTVQGLEVAGEVGAAYARALRERLLTGVSGSDLASAATVLTALAAAHADEADDPPDLIAGERDPALPERRGRGRASGPPST
jgi:DNA-binding MarR family transcriptional regulator